MKTTILNKLTVCLALWFVIGTATVVEAAKKPKHVLVVTVTKGYRHSSIPTAEKVLQQISEKTGEFTLDFARTDEELMEKSSLAALTGYDGVIFANTTGMLPLADKEGFINWIREGHGFIGMHSATDTFKAFPEYVEMIGGSFRAHGDQVTVEALVEDPLHPATAHFKSPYFVHDEIYLLNNYFRDNVHLLLALDKHPNTRHPGHYPIAWNKRFGKGRVFYTSLGHREDVWESYPYQQHITGGILWALGLKVGDDRPQVPTPTLSPSEYFDGFLFLFNGRNLDGWKLRDPDGVQSWAAENGMLVNHVTEEQHGTDLVSERKFRDFTLRYEYMVAPGSNSGMYLRGRYEIQILDDYNSSQSTITGNGALYNFKAPKIFASRPAGEWNQVEATILGNHVTVTLNGIKIHDNVEVPRATGGQLDDDLDAPGPILLQGDHGAVAFRNIRIKEIHGN